MMQREREFWESKAVAGGEELHTAIWGEPDVPQGWHSTNPECLTLIEPWLPDCGAVLDLGCGIGRLAIPLAKKYPQLDILAVDISSHMILRGGKAAHEAGVENIRWMVGDGTRLPFGGQINGAYSFAMFQHIPASAMYGYLTQVQKALRSGCRFVFQVVDGNTTDFLSHAVPVSQLRQWCVENGWREKDVSRGHLHAEWVWLVLEKQ